MNPAEFAFVTFLQVIAVSGKLHADSSSTFELASGEGTEDDSAHRAEVNRAMLAKTAVFLGNDRIDEMLRVI